MSSKMTPGELLAALVALNVDDASSNRGGWATVGCPACGDMDRPSLRVNVNTGEYKCFRCDSSSKNDGLPLGDFIANPSMPSLMARGSTSGRAGLPELTMDLVERYHRFLMDSPSVVSDVERKRGWTAEIMRELKIGWDGSHLWIPILDPTKTHLRNCRLYDPFRRTRVKSFHYANASGLKRTTVWVPGGLESLEGHDTIWMFEGEPDGILSYQMGFPTALITGGAGVWDDEILSIGENQKFVLCYDVDSAGRRGARGVAARLRSHERQVLDLRMTISEGNTDFTDAVVKDQRDARWFKELARAGWGGEEPKGTDPPIPVGLGGGVPNEPIIVRAHVLGGHTVPILSPQQIDVTCRADWQPEGQCQICPVRAANNMLRVEVDPESQDLAILCVTKAVEMRGAFKRIASIPYRCPRARFDVGSMWQVQHLKLIPPMSERHGGESMVRSAMFVCPADGRPIPVRSNQLYEFRGKVVPDVISNEWTLQSADARPAEDDIDSFRMDAEMRSHLSSAFNPKSWTTEALEESISAEEDSLSRHITKVYGRNLMLRIVDLTYHSVIKFKFEEDLVRRGWMSVAIFGDTRTGKSEIMERFAQYVGFGKVIMDPANTTFAGLVGGLQQVGRGDKSWAITWGLIPTNDRGMVIIDEISSLSIRDISGMSGMRSSGIAELTKIRSASTPARTRLIMAGNPRGKAMTLSSYGTPVEGLMDLIGTPEDIARFDVAIGVKQGLDKKRAQKRLGDQPQPIMIDLRRALIKFAWSRRSNQVEWESGVESYIADELAPKMARDYSREVPLVEPSEQDLRIARISVATAVRSFSVSDDPNIVLVRKGHAEFAESLMREAYSGDLGYEHFSEFQSRQKLNEGAATAVVVKIQRDVAATCRSLLVIRRVNPNSIGMAIALDGGEARHLISKLIQCGAASFSKEDVRSTAVSWTPGFITLLRDLEKNPPEIEGEEMF